EKSVMPFEDFKRTWKVTVSNSPQCEGDDTVVISGVEKAVKVTCFGKDKTYSLEGAYDELTNRIKGEGFGIGLQIMYEAEGQTPITGSWTAEDTAGGGGDG
ncbi:MAG TPA: hypothetical protein VF173_37900, partial [Thermoanaerobaculia bacterium]|nr:hypothetical protein [Thermoanaerobaculia bacterium]